MIEVILDASQLESFEPCPRKWYYQYQLSLIPNRANKSWDIGSYYHEVLAKYYSTFHKTNDFLSRMKEALDFARTEALLNKFKLVDKEARKFHLERLITYFTKNQAEDEGLMPLLNANGDPAIEQGFSNLLYEDNSRRYILEGKIDLIMKGPPYKIAIIDHKTQSRKDDHWIFNHQAMNYLSAVPEAEYFVYNYIGLQDKLPLDGIRRHVFKPPAGRISQWKMEVMNTFDDMYDCLEQEKRLKDFGNKPKVMAYKRRRSACDNSKYGLCMYHKICSVSDYSDLVQVTMSAYRTREEKWKAW